MKKIPKSDFKHDMRATCEIYGEKNEGKIAIDDEFIYFCSNNKRLDGSSKKKFFGYEYSWSFLCTDEEYWLESFESPMKNLIVYPGIRDIMDVQYGDMIQKQDKTRKVLGVVGDIVFLSNCNISEVCNSLFTKDELKKNGYTIKQDIEEEEQIQEFTIQEIADKMGIPVEKLRIKD